jgi:hypothetical protein
MAEKTEKFVTVPDPDRCPVTFVNHVIAAGHLNGVVNVTFSVALFSPNEQGTVDADMKVASRLRMDMGCAHQLHEQLGRILDQAKYAFDQVLATAIVSSAMPGKSGKSN